MLNKTGKNIGLLPIQLHVIYRITFIEFSIHVATFNTTTTIVNVHLPVIEEKLAWNFLRL